jgi:hypothetical protein
MVAERAGSSLDGPRFFGIDFGQSGGVCSTPDRPRRFAYGGTLGLRLEPASAAKFYRHGQA